jgi:hypothetical protein
MSLRRLQIDLLTILALALLPFWSAGNEPGSFAEPRLLADAAKERAVLAGKVQAEVEAALASAKQLMRDDPTGVEQNLKLMLDNLERLPGLDADVGSRLRHQVQMAIRKARHQRAAADERSADAKQSKAAAQELERLNIHLDDQQQRLKQLVDRFNSLLDERRHSVGSEQIVPEVQRLAPGSAIAASLDSAGALQQAVHENEQTSRSRSNNFVRSLASVESAAVAFADEPPLVYASAERWQELTREREKYKAVEFGKKGKAEQRILDELNKPTTMDVVEMPLRDVMRFLADSHGIPIVLSAKKLEEASISLETPVTKSLHGITLRSALRLILKDLELSYLVQDEVVQITTPEDAAVQLTHKVYPVGDLVVPVRMPNNIFGLGGLSGMGGINGGPGMGNPLGNGMNNGVGNPALPAMNGPGFPPINPGVF